MAVFKISYRQIDVVSLPFIAQLLSTGGFSRMDIGMQKWIPFPGTNLGNCPQLRQDIKTCQGHGKTIHNMPTIY
ncbi:hypothetical protein SI65_03231 [Aspergillus cristatus]|uniref:Uncharacterized protein n=1 Tax=Aspergillus cristatus TaxID=573508 RepID=A0A1E3BN50_ASPCR|nr:hypothetical protein SI65_03231 [Aspergillus cristatus]